MAPEIMVVLCVILTQAPAAVLEIDVSISSSQRLFKVIDRLKDGGCDVQTVQLSMSRGSHSIKYKHFLLVFKKDSTTAFNIARLGWEEERAFAVDEPPQYVQIKMWQGRWGCMVDGGS